MQAPSNPIAMPSSSSVEGSTMSLTAVTMLNITVLRFVRAETAPMGPRVIALFTMDNPMMFIILPRVPIVKS